MTSESQPLRVFLALEETPLHQPRFVERLIENTQDTIVGAALLLWFPPKSNAQAYLMRNLRQLRAREMLSLAGHKVRVRTEKILRRAHLNGAPHSVRGVLERHKIPYFEVRNSINRPEHVAKIRAFEPDVILSSQAQILKREILSIPRKGCLNRHSSLLPSYAGLWPVFHAIRQDEKEVGVTVHTMDEGIDSGVPLAQRRFTRGAGESMSELYAKCFEASVDACLDALDKVRNNDLTPCTTHESPSYYSFPTAQQWREFREHGGRFI